MVNIPTKDEAVVISEINDKTVLSYTNTDSIVKLFQSDDLQNYLSKTDNALQLNIKIKENYRELHQSELEILSEKCNNKSIVIFLESKDERQFSIYWKSKENSQFLAIKRFREENVGVDKKIYEYIANFLASSLKRGELGKF